jgi:hypothetical protein
MSTAGRCSSCAATEQSPNRLLDVCRQLVLIQKFGFETIPTQRKPTLGELDLPFQVVELWCPTMADFLIPYDAVQSPPVVKILLLQAVDQPSVSQVFRMSPHCPVFLRMECSWRR